MSDGGVSENQPRNTIKNEGGGMIFSYSRLKLYETCPFRFYLKYVEGREEPVTKPLALGKAVHKAIELIIQGEAKDSAIIQGLAESEFHPEVSVQEVKWLVERAPIREGMGKVETHFKLPLEDSPNSPVLQGFTDLYYYTGSEGVPVIVDWKTNRRPFDALKNHQLPLYAWALMKMKKVSSVIGYLYFLRFRQRNPDPYALFTEENIEPSRQWAIKLAKEVEDKVFLAEIFPDKRDSLFPPKPSSLCKFCPFVLECYQKFH